MKWLALQGTKHKDLWRIKKPDKIHMLPAKFSSHGLKTLAVRWIYGYFTRRKQQTKIDSCNSSYRN